MGEVSCGFFAAPCISAADMQWCAPLRRQHASSPVCASAVVAESIDETAGKPRNTSNKMDKSLRNDQIESRFHPIHKELRAPPAA
jgi:hypothetical protein